MATSETITDPETAAKSKFCGECRFYQKQIRRLREKLEYAELKNLKLLSECSRLRKELSEAEFRGRSSVSRRPSPILPDEILHEIFAFATHVEGELVSPHWRVEEPYAPWVISSQARRSIPLVCRRWYDVGLKYLYQHIVLFTQRQLVGLLYIIDYFARDPELRTKRPGWIRGLEIVLLQDDVSEGHELARRIFGLIRRLPQKRLRLFGFEGGYCQMFKSQNMAEIVADALHKTEGSLEVLHLPCMQAQHGKGGSVYYSSFSGDFDLSTTGSTGLSELRTISLTSGRWKLCDTSCRNDRENDIISFLTHNPHSIHTVYLDWSHGTQSQLGYNKHLNFLRSAPCLHTVHVIFGRTEIVAEDIDAFLEAVPQIQCLVITPSDQGLGSANRRELNRDVVFHESLEEIILVTNPSSAYQAVFATNPFFSKIQAGHLPKLKRVIVRGSYLEGCIDSGLVLSQSHEQCWKVAIKAYAEQGVDLVDQQGNVVHLWSDRHDIRITPEEEDTQSEVSSSEEGEWWELSSAGFSGSSVASDDVISDDSEDSPYRYISHPDLDYDSSSVASDN